MKPQNLHAHEDRLLDFAYGELPAQEAHVVESHLQGCTRCTELLNGIRGVRSTMAQLTLEPAPDAGLDSLMAYAQQAARNAAAGPALKPTWWRRWLVPAMGVAAVSIFGIVTIQVNKSVDLQPELSATLKKQTLEESAPPAPPPAAAAPLAAVTPPPPELPAKMDMDALEKSKAPSRKKAMKSDSYDGDSDWSNAGLGTRDSKSKGYAYDRRDAMTQSGAFSKPKPMLVPTGKDAPSTPPAPTQAAPPPPAAVQSMAGPADDAMAEEDNMGAEYGSAEAQMQQQAPSRGSLSLREAKRGNTAPAADKEAAPAELASLDTAMPSQAKQEQRARAPEVTAAAGGAAPQGRAERQAASPDELSKLASVAMRRGDRVSEAQYLRQALDAGATGKDRLGLLSRLCDAEFSIGRRQAAIEACNLAIDEAPSSSAAQVARRRLSQESVDTQPGTRLSAPKSSSPLKASEMEAPASAPVPAQ